MIFVCSLVGSCVSSGHSCIWLYLNVFECIIWCVIECELMSMNGELDFLLSLHSFWIFHQTLWMRNSFYSLSCLLRFFASHEIYGVWILFRLVWQVAKTWRKLAGNVPKLSTHVDRYSLYIECIYTMNSVVCWVFPHHTCFLIRWKHNWAGTENGKRYCSNIKLHKRGRVFVQGTTLEYEWSIKLHVIFCKIVLVWHIRLC